MIKFHSILELLLSPLVNEEIENRFLQYCLLEDQSKSPFLNQEPPMLNIHQNIRILTKLLGEIPNLLG